MSDIPTATQIFSIFFNGAELFKPKHHLDVLIERRMELILADPKHLPEVTELDRFEVDAKPTVDALENAALSDIIIF